MGEYCQHRYDSMKRDLIDNIRWSQNFDDFVNNVFKYRYYCIENGLDINDVRIFDINNPSDQRYMKKIKSFYDKRKVSKDFNKWFKKTYNTSLIKNFKFYASRIFHNNVFQCITFCFCVTLVPLIMLLVCEPITCVK